MNKIISVISALFLCFMIFITLASRPIHNSSLPHVEVITVKKQDFICEFADEQNTLQSTERRALGIPRKLLSGDIYVITQCEVYGEMRDFSYKVNVELYDNYFSDEYAAVLSGVSINDKIIISSDIPITDGGEVIIV